MNKVIASLELIFLYPNGEERKEEITIGEPYESDDAWWVNVDVGSIAEHNAPIAGADSMQALVLAVGLVKTTLTSFKSQEGAEIYDDEKSVFVIDEYFPAII